MDNTWQLQEAKSKFSRVVDDALARGAQIVTRHGKNAVVVLPYDDYLRLTGREGSLVHYLMASPLAGCGIAIEHGRETPREIGIEQ